VTPERRLVRATLEFFQDLDRQLGSERGLNGEPSTNDFQVLDLLRIIDRFASEFDSMPELISGRSDYRVLVGTGFVVAGYLVVGQLASDGAVELVELELDVELGWD
jgi:hypothetical protein